MLRAAEFFRAAPSPHSTIRWQTRSSASSLEGRSVNEIRNTANRTSAKGRPMARSIAPLAVAAALEEIKCGTRLQAATASTPAISGQCKDVHQCNVLSSASLNACSSSNPSTIDCFNASRHHAALRSIEASSAPRRRKTPGTRRRFPRSRRHEFEGANERFVFRHRPLRVSSPLASCPSYKAANYCRDGRVVRVSGAIHIAP